MIKQTRKYHSVQCPEENIDNDANLFKLVDILNTLADTYKYPVIVSTHPRTRKRFNSMNVNLNKRVMLTKPLGFIDYNKLQITSKAVLSDSGTLTEEASLLKFPAIMIRGTHERPEGVDSGILIMSGFNAKCHIAFPIPMC